MKCLYIYNPFSGKSKAEKNKDYICQKLSKVFDKVVVVKTERPNHAQELAQNASKEFTHIVVAGGDGTLNEVINGIAKSGKKRILGYIPLGTVNDFAHSVGIPRSIKGALNTIANGKVINHEIFKAGNQYGVYVCALGVGTESSYSTKQKIKKKLGKFAYFIDGAKKVFFSKSIPLDLTYEGGHIQGNFASFLAINSKFVASFKINEQFIYNDGVVDLILVKNNKKRVTFSTLMCIARLFLFGLKGRLPKRVTRLKLDNFELKVPENTVVNLDGEGIKNNNFKFSVIKDGLQIIVPKK